MSPEEPLELAGARFLQAGVDALPVTQPTVLEQLMDI